MDEQQVKPLIRKRSRFLSWIKKILSATEAKIACKTGVAASISLIIGLSYSHVFDRPDTLVSGLWCVMASIVVMQAHLGGTYKAAWIRFLGVVIGSTAGAILIDFMGTGPVSLGISVFLTIVLCALLNIKDSFRIAGLSTAIIIIMGGRQPAINPWLFSFYRFLDSCVGILVAVLVARLLWPEKAIENIRKNISKTLNLLSKYFRLSVHLEPESQRHEEISSSLSEEILTLLEENRDYSGEAKIELFDNVSLREHWYLITDQSEIIFESVNNLKHLPKEMLSKILDDGLANQLTDVIDKIEITFQSLEKIVASETAIADPTGLDESIKKLNEELLRFRATRTTRKFNLEDVETYFVFFYGLRSIAEALIKMERQIKELSKMS